MKKNIITKSVLKLVFFVLVCSIMAISCRKYDFVKDVPMRSPHINYLPELTAIQNQVDSLNVKKNKDSVNNLYQGLTDEQIYLKEKYSIILGISPDKLMNYDLYAFIDRWINTPHKDNSFTLQGVSSPYLIQALYSEVYKVSLPAVPSMMFTSQNFQKFTGRPYLEEGDIIFFRYNRSSPISEVAIFLQNGRIFMSNVGRGVNIYDFNNDYYQERYVAAGRPIIPEK